MYVCCSNCKMRQGDWLFGPVLCQPSGIIEAGDLHAKANQSNRCCGRAFDVLSDRSKLRCAGGWLIPRAARGCNQFQTVRSSCAVQRECADATNAAAARLPVKQVVVRCCRVRLHSRWKGSCSTSFSVFHIICRRSCAESNNLPMNMTFASFIVKVFLWLLLQLVVHCTIIRLKRFFPRRMTAVLFAR